jgi:hypothetical protein
MGQFFVSLVDTQEVQHFDPREFIAQGDKVVALGHYAWLVKSTGREFGVTLRMCSPYIMVKS